MVAITRLGLAALLNSLSLLTSVRAATYTLTDNYVGSNFLSDFSFQAIADPTHGRVDYIDQATAQSLGLVSSTSDSFVMRADSTTTLTASGPGRKAIRIQSNKQYTTHVIVWDVNHMPEGCGTWPAAWEVGADWPNQGETDIIEGVNNQEPNQSTLHTAAGCTMPSTISGMSGHPGNKDCEGNDGCGVQADAPNSFGPQFNNIGGGVYAMERTSTFIKVWYWARNDNSIPSDVKNHATIVDTSGWPEPYALFPNTDCNIPQYFGPHNIIINLTFCGDWAGQQSVWEASGCPADTCVDYVNNNPSAFANAYWDLASVRVFE